MARAQRIKKTTAAMKKLRLKKAENRVNNCFRSSCEATTDVVTAVTPVEILQEQRSVEDSIEAPRSLQTNSLTSRPSAGSNEQAAIKKRVVIAQKQIQDKKSNTSTNVLDDAIRSAISQIYGEDFRAKDAQVACIRRLVYNRINVILIARTGFGKSLVMQAVSILRRDTTTIIFLPLNEIAKEQVRKVNQIGGRALFLNADVKDMDKEIKLAKDGRYTHIFISPELASTPAFRDVLKDPNFKKRLAMIVVDEAHLIVQWGKEFRPEYSQLRYVRNLIGNIVPWFACSATLDPKSLETVKKSLGFKNDDVHIEQTPIARRELVFRLGQIPKDTITAYTSLRFLLDDAIDPPVADTYLDPTVFQEGMRSATPHKIPKTVIFFNTRAQAMEAHQRTVEYLQQLQPDYYTEEVAYSIMAVFHRTISSYRKQAILADFRQLAELSKIRIVFATEAIGIGVDFPDLRRVVIYMIPSPEPHFSLLLQRGGRAGRDGNGAEVIFLFEHWCFGERDPQLRPKAANRLNFRQQQQSRRSRSPSPNSINSDDSLGNNTAQSKSRGRKEDKKKRTEMRDEFFRLCNDDMCIKKTLYEYFAEPEDFFIANTNKDSCCSRCNDTLKLLTLERTIYNENGATLNARKNYILDRLKTWAQTSATSTVIGKSAMFPIYYTVAVPHTMLYQIACQSHQIFTRKCLNKYTRDWEHAERLSDELWLELRAAGDEYDKVLPSSQDVDAMIGLSSPSFTPSQSQCLSMRSMFDAALSAITASQATPVIAMSSLQSRLSSNLAPPRLTLRDVHALSTTVRRPLASQSPNIQPIQKAEPLTKRPRL